MRSKRDRDKEMEEIAQSHAEAEELSEKELKKLERQEGVEKRRKARQKDKVARFAGIIMLGMVLFIGFLLLILGEIQSSSSQKTITPVETQTDPAIFRVR